MNLDSRKGGVRASRFYALTFVALTGILSVVLPPDLDFASAQNSVESKASPTITLDKIVGEYTVILSPEVLADAVKDGVRSVTGRWIIKSNGTFEALLKAVSTKDEVQEIRTTGKITIRNGKVVSQVETVNGEKPNQTPRSQLYTLSTDGKELQADDQPVKLVKYSPLVSSDVQTTPDSRAEAVRLINQGQQFMQSKQYQKAIDSWQQSLIIFRQLGDFKAELTVLYAIGANYFLLGDLQKGQKFLLQSIELARKVGDRETEAQSTDLLNQVNQTLLSATSQDRKVEADRLVKQGNQQSQISQFDLAIQLWQQALTIYREIKYQQGEAGTLGNLGNTYRSLGKYDKAIEFYLQNLVIERELKNRLGEVNTLRNLGLAYSALAKYDKAIEYHLQSLAMSREIKNHLYEGAALENLGLAYSTLGKYDKAIEFHLQLLTLTREIKDRQGEGQSLGSLGNAYSTLGKYDKAIEFHLQRLAIAREIKDRQGEGAVLGNLGITYFSLSKYDKAIEFYLQALLILQEIKDRKGESATLGNLGNAYYSLGKYDKAIEYHRQSLAITQEIKDRRGEGLTLGNLGIAYFSLGKYEKAIEFYLQYLAITQGIKDRRGEGGALGNLGIAYFSLGKYEKAIDYHLQSLEIAREIKDRRGEGRALGNLGSAYDVLGKYDKAIDYYLQHLTISREIKDRNGEGAALGNLGIAYSSLGKYGKAIDYHLQSLAIMREVKDRKGEENALGSLGLAFNKLGKYDNAINYLLQGLAITQEIKDRQGEGAKLVNLGITYGSLGKYGKAIDYLLQGLAIAREIKDRRSEGISLGNLGNAFNELKQPELTILFYKQSINVSESIRKDLRKLDKDLQKSYLNTIEGSYRILADLLLQQGRIIEALQVLDLLKVQELQDFFKDVKGNEKTAQGIELLNEEKEYWQSFNKQNIDLTTANTPQILQQLRQTAPAQNIKLAAYKDLQTRLQKLGSNSALLYPLILEDRLELVLFVPNAPPISRTVKVTQTELIKVAEQFREDIQKPNSLAVLDPANKLYNWMIEPIANDLKQANITTIIYAPDGVMRHVPLAALYDGKQWLVEKYRINYITALSLTNIDPQIQQTPRILAGAFTDRSGTVKIGDNNISFSSLPAALPEVENLVSNFPNTTKLIDKDFNRKAIASDKLNQYNIIHFATHAHLVAGSPEDSFVLLNNNEYVTLRQVKDWKLPNVGLAVFSACQTALGGKLSSGIEIIGFGYQLQQAQARASIATLWEISDGGTQALMGKFYERMKLTSSSAEALQQSQIDLIRSNGKSTDEKRAGVRITWQGIKPEVESQLNHPYYWATFILIGNGF
ncbi:tetratricopeptide repeat protein [Pseudanabaena galeata UHCC 0370]|uniref:Tetratricopeptide repeat protein n=1 Tax=Pseudanabaena galeata UHCC 0370 TaxID=3110310 RepID=A0ABU5TEX9_9CYAN|nr:tetratricopeptide repeat protein [Pseudanabaena galeata]MEA5476760.1 tetratricopeptide repeat protein [Pseudanabaena galeata UHCC 0370]